MKRAASLLLLLLAGLTGACRGAPPETVSPLPDDEAWSLAEARDDIIATSCPAGIGHGFSQSFLLEAAPVEPGATDEVASALPGLSYLGGWALSADMASFGGLSGLDVMASGDLLAVSDGGALVEIGFDQDALRPTGQTTLSFFADSNGDIISGKAEADAEGLHYDGGVALVSFERDHRVLAFAYGVCGSSARAVTVSEFGAFTGLDHSVAGNAGPEGLVLLEDRLVAGLETVVGGLGPLAVVGRDGVPRFDAQAWADGGGMPLVGLDAMGGTLFALHRAWNPLTGNRIVMTRRAPDGEMTVLGTLQRPLTVDNFEGIAAAPGPDGSTRLFIIADDNFSERQRTLLFVFEVAA